MEKKIRRSYTDPNDDERRMSPSAVRKLSKNKQIEVMRLWFGENYEDPVHSQPYDSEEGGYIYIDGGPFDAREELGEEFDGIVKERTIAELADELSNDCMGWTHSELVRHQHYMDDFYDIDALLGDDAHIDGLYQNLISMRSLLNKKDSMEAYLQRFQLIMIFSFCITSLETYLWNVFTERVLKDGSLKEKYIQTDKRIAGFKKSAVQIYLQRDKLAEMVTEVDDHIKRTLQDTTFHNIVRTKKLYKGVLNIELNDFEQFDSFVKKRHDFVHRGGKDKDGQEVHTSKDEVLDLIKRIEMFCHSLDAKLRLSSLPDSIPF